MNFLNVYLDFPMKTYEFLHENMTETRKYGQSFLCGWILYCLLSCQVTKRDEDSSLMQLKEEFRTYEALRREHDAQIVHIAMEAGLRISPEQWSSLLYGDLVHKSHMQSIIDKVAGIIHMLHCHGEHVWFMTLLLCGCSCSLQSRSLKACRSWQSFCRGRETQRTWRALDLTSSY